jgi:DNA-binding response OmpR family regulator
LVPARSVLVVDPQEETREILRTALERRGLRILQAGGTAEALEVARQNCVDLIVLDMEISGPADGVPEQLRAETGGQTTPVIVLGTVRTRGIAKDHFVSKPYHYGPLIRKIEALLAARS